MVARARKPDESFKKYRKKLIKEAEMLKIRLSPLYGAANKGSFLVEASKRFANMFAGNSVIETKKLIAKRLAKRKAKRKAQQNARRAQR